MSRVGHPLSQLDRGLLFCARRASFRLEAYWKQGVAQKYDPCLNHGPFHYLKIERRACRQIYRKIHLAAERADRIWHAGRAEFAFVVIDLTYVENSIFSEEVFITLMAAAFR